MRNRSRGIFKEIIGVFFRVIFPSNSKKYSHNSSLTWIKDFMTILKLKNTWINIDQFVQMKSKRMPYIKVKGCVLYIYIYIYIYIFIFIICIFRVQR